MQANILWTIVGVVGTLLFGGRWILQVISSHKAGKPVVSAMFWYVSIVGNILLLSYFVFGHRDSVGILSNIFPLTIAFYNLWLLKKAKI